jgi:protein tyrosine phosphatase
VFIDSDGVGRTGTYIALDILIQKAEAEGKVDIFTCVRNLRQERVKMVQNVVSILII